MIRFVIISVALITYTTAKIYSRNFGGKNGDNIDRDGARHGAKGYIVGDPMWVLRLDNEHWLDAKLRLASFEELEDFYDVVGPMIGSRSPRVKKNDPRNPTATPTYEPRSNNDLRNDIMKLVNKFAMSTRIEPDSYLRENEDANTPSIALYFKGPLCSLVVKLGNKQWHYVIKTGPFPEWFYERHDTFEDPLSIPDAIKNTFYHALLRTLNLMLYHPI